ncbi:MAG: rhomboid family intramembrane serine protease [Myxococcales bacterium]
MSDLDPLGGLPQSAEPASTETRSEEVRSAETHRGPPAPTTMALLALLGVMFLAEIWMGGGLGPDPLALFRLGSLSAAAVRDGDWWRLGSYAFLHAGPLHLLFNAYALWILMRPIESLFGPAVALGLFAATAIAGGGASIAAATLRHTDWQQAVGASGGIFGLFGAHVALYWRLRHRLAPEARKAAARTLIFNLLINLALAVGAQAANFPLDNAAHAGGFLSGILLGLLAPSHVLPERPWSRPAFVLLIGASFALAGMEGAAIARAVNPHARTLRGQGAHARVPWDLVPGRDGHGRSAGGVEVVLRRLEGDIAGGHDLALGGRTWSKLATTDPEGNPTVVLTAPDGAAHLVIQAWCYDPDCTEEKRDALAEEVAAGARGAL